MYCMHYTLRNFTLDINMSICFGAGLDRMHARSFTHTHVYVDHTEPMLLIGMQVYWITVT